MPKVFTSKTQKVGEIGEGVARKFLMKQGFSILDRNYTKKWGEIDIVAKKDKKLYFIEVKSVCRPNLENVTHETADAYQPEDNMHPWKMERLSRTIQSYLWDKQIKEETEWQTDLLIVFLDLEGKRARVKVVKDIVL